MTPAVAAALTKGFAVRQRPTKTYKMDMEKGSVQGYTDGLEAVRQAIHKILMTERYQYIMYSWDYGIELQDLYGEPISYVCPELERRISEALLCDDRIRSADNFDFDLTRKRVVHVSFTARTIFGEIKAGREVEI